ncbi:MAG: PEP-CTERM sorting domain-containing protein [Planctomycetota bacterium]
MKKLLVLSLVLAVASMASAGIVYRVGGVEYAAGSTVNALGNVTVELYNQTTTTSAPTFAGVSDVGGYTGALVPAGKITSVVLDNPGNLPGTWSNSDIYYNTYTYGVWRIDYDVPAVADTLAGVLVTIDLAGVAEGDSFAMLDGAWELQDAGITFIPEPATMVLLGLGGLLIRRKK